MTPILLIDHSSSSRLSLLSNRGYLKEAKATAGGEEGGQGNTLNYVSLRSTFGSSSSFRELNFPVS